VVSYFTGLTERQISELYEFVKAKLDQGCSLRKYETPWKSQVSHILTFSDGHQFEFWNTVYDEKDKEKAEQLKTQNIYKIEDICGECDLDICAYSRKSLCLFPLVGGRRPNITKKSGCADFVPWAACS
jgi:hypothetical protein